MAEQSNLEAEARRALELGEERFRAGDIAGARGCARYALCIAPGLPGADQALVAYDVHAAAARGPTGPDGAPDWHAVLGLRPPAAGASAAMVHDDVKRQHRRLCLLVHPDKNPSAAAEGAFKLVQAAYDALSAAADRRAWEEEQARRFWQAAPYDVTPPPPAPKQPPIARPTPRRAPPTASAGHGQPAPPPPAPPAGYGQPVPPPAPAPRQSPIYLLPPPQAALPRGHPERPPQRPICPLLPYCLFCRSHDAAGPNEGFAMHGLPTGIHGQQQQQQTEFRGFGVNGDYYYC
ncbi:unnamed protein product [Urochloa humidicola]